MKGKGRDPGSVTRINAVSLNIYGYTCMFLSKVKFSVEVIYRTSCVVIQ